MASLKPLVILAFSASMLLAACWMALTTRAPGVTYAEPGAAASIR